MSAADLPSSASTASVSAPGQGGGRSSVDGVRSNRGAGADCTTPSTGGYVPRAASCGCSVASSPVQHRRHAGVAAGEHLGPLVPGAGREQRGPALLGRRPAGRVEPPVRPRARRHRPFRTVAAARRRTSAPARRPRSPGRRRSVDVVERRAGVEQVVPGRRRPAAGVAPAEHEVGQRAPCRRRSPRRPPGPGRCGAAASSAPTTPKASIIPPPPKSPSRFIGGTGGGRRPGRSRSARRSPRCSRCRGRRPSRVDRPGPSRSSARRPAPG